MEKNRAAITRSPLFENLSRCIEAFDNLDITDASAALDAKTNRETCQTCGQSRMWFCYQCRRPLESLQLVFPRLELPFRIDIIKHNREPDGKSTGVHAAILSADVNMYTYPDIPQYEPSKVLLIFPNDFTFATLCSENRENEKSPCRLCNDTHKSFPFDTVIFIDSSWAQTKRIILDERIATLPFRAGLTGRKSVFWRPLRNRNLEHLSTIEAIHEVCSMWLESQNCPQSRKVDNLLFLFKYMHNKISNRYREMLQ